MYNFINVGEAASGKRDGLGCLDSHLPDALHRPRIYRGDYWKSLGVTVSDSPKNPLLCECMVKSY